MNDHPEPSSSTTSVPSAFVYGTLQVPIVLERVLGRVPPSASAVLHGFERRSIEGQCYPGIITAPGHQARGCVLLALTDAEWALLDDYEGDMYLRRWVSVALDDGSPAYRVQSYVLRAEYTHLLGAGGWSLTHFIEHDLEVFLADLE
jgi:gamma-glutamylcyclotransferase (GGCT)/AIG2-like uncharacterized protein YtfP